MRTDHISTHTLTWSVTIRRTVIEKGKQNFNSHAHVERDNQTKGYLDKFYISTHTLTWSVTAHGVKKLDITPISTHTLTWSVTNQHLQE